MGQCLARSPELWVIHSLSFAHFQCHLDWLKFLQENFIFQPKHCPACAVKKKYEGLPVQLQQCQKQLKFFPCIFSFPSAVVKGHVPTTSTSTWEVNSVVRWYDVCSASRAICVTLPFCTQVTPKDLHATMNTVQSSRHYALLTPELLKHFLNANHLIY